jgi:hypothetical protein
VQSNHVKRCASSTASIHSVNIASFGTYFTMWVSRGTTDSMSILWDSLENPILDTFAMKLDNCSCFSSLFCKYFSTNSCDPYGVPSMSMLSFAG